MYSGILNLTPKVTYFAGDTPGLFCVLLSNEGYRLLRTNSTRCLRFDTKSSVFCRWHSWAVLVFPCKVKVTAQEAAGKVQAEMQKVGICDHVKTRARSLWDQVDKVRKTLATLLFVSRVESKRIAEESQEKTRPAVLLQPLRLTVKFFTHENLDCSRQHPVEP